ncbi:MAG TPA: hypothetical protein P5293_00360 [Bacteroidales bacterium]|nr:hypothetical protein [Bacteroidales bacterium]
MAITVNIHRATPSNFRLKFPTLPSETSRAATAELELNLFGTVIPGLSLDQAESPWQGGKLQLQVGKLVFDSWTVNFIVDSEFRNWKALANWIFYINNNKDKFGVLPNNMVVDASLQITDNFSRKIMAINFKNVWIQQLGEITLSTREGGAVLEASATFIYDRYEIG